MEIVCESAFPFLSEAELLLMSALAVSEHFSAGEYLFKSGQEKVDLFIVQQGQVDIVNPRCNDEVLVSHRVGQFTGDIDLLTLRPALVSAVAACNSQVLRVKNDHVRDVLLKIPQLSEKLLTAFQLRRDMLSRAKDIGLKVMGPAMCSDTNMIREFLHKNFVPFTWYDTGKENGDDNQAYICKDGEPSVTCADGTVLSKPTLRQVAVGAGIWQHCPNQAIDFAVIGAGPAGLAAAVYAASEGLSTLVIDSLGPGGQSGGSSKIENFMGFPSGISGTDLATRGSLQLLKFGAEIVAPVTVTDITPGATEHDHVKLTLDCGAVVSAMAVLIASGVVWRKLEAENAQRFERAGIYYACTTVEAMLHDRSDVAVVGAGNSAGQAATFLADCCPDRQVHLIIRGKLGPKMSEYLSARIRANSRITVHEETEITEVIGVNFIESVLLKKKSDAGTSESLLAVSAIFVFIGSQSSAEWIPSLVARDSDGFLLTGSDMEKAGHWPLTSREPCALETSMPRVLAAGDIRSGTTKRVGFAVGDGSHAVSCVHRLRSIVR
ncbi:FAD-dependent oxidoreductase [soil metagenome]